MGNKLRLSSVVLALACSAAMPSWALTVWDEAAQGDLSGQGLQPTLVPMGLGANVLLGSMGNGGQGIDRDYFSFSVPLGAVLSAIRLLDNTAISGGSSFIAIQAGPQLTVSTSGLGVENLLGFAHYGPDQIGTDLLPALLGTAPAQLPDGTYSVWMQETGGLVGYGLEFVITPVPEPAALWLLGSGLAALRLLRRAVPAR